MAPPEDAGVWAPAGAARANEHATARAAQDSFLWVSRDGILFRAPAGLADGLALKELRFSSIGDSPQWPKSPWFPRSVALHGFGVA